MIRFTWSRFLVMATFLAVGSVPEPIRAQMITVYLNNPAGNYDLANPLSWEANYTPPGPATTGRIFLVRDPSGTQYQKEFTMSSDWSIGTLNIFGVLSYDQSIDLLGNTMSTNLVITSWPHVELRNGKFVGSTNEMISFKNIQFEGDLNTSSLPFTQVKGTINSTPFNGGAVFGSGTNISVASIGGNQTTAREPFGGVEIRDGGVIQTNQTIAQSLNVQSGSQFTSTESNLQSVRASGTGTEVDIGTFKAFGSRFINSPTSLDVFDGATVRFAADYLQATVNVSGQDAKLTVDPAGSTRLWSVPRRSSISNGGELDFGSVIDLSSFSSLTVDDGTVTGAFTINGGDLDLKDANLIGSSITLNSGRLLGSGHFTGSIGGDLFAIFRAVMIPEGTLSFDGNFASFAPIEFDFRSVNDFDRIEIGGQMFTFPSMKIRFANGFRGSVGDEIEFIRADGGLPMTGVPLGAISLLNLPTGYAFLTQADANSVFVRITAVPDVPSAMLVSMGVMAGAIICVYRRRSA